MHDVSEKANLHLKSKLSPWFSGHPAEIQRDILVSYISNHSSSKVSVPFSCALVGAFLAQWSDPWAAVLWVVATCLISFWTTYVCKKFEDAGNIDLSEVKKWLIRIAVPRFLFSVAWTTIIFWAWTPEHPETFFIVTTILCTTMAMNAAQSGPIIELYFAEVLTKLIPLLAVAIYDSDFFQIAISIMAVAGVLQFTKIAFNLNAINRSILTQRYQLEKAKREAEQASDAKSAFLATMSHEVRTPLNGILGVISLLKYTRLSKRQDEYVDTIRYSGETLLTMLNDVLDFSKIESGKFDIEEVAFDTTKLIKSVVNLMWSRAVEKKITLQCRIAENVPPYIVSDPTRLRQVLLNLMSNAIKFTEKGGVTLNVTAVPVVVGNDSVPPAAFVKFEVKDTGIGVPESSKNLLFKDFSQVDSSISRRYGGTGLGLSICKRIVEMMNGDISCESTEGLGSSFWFNVPVQIAEYRDVILHSDDENEVKEIPVLSPLKILLAEDNIVNQQIAIGLLSHYGHSVDTVENGQLAFDAAQRGFYDVILMDVQMPGVDGIQATKMIRQLGRYYATMPIIALTANVMESDLEKYKEAGMSGHIAKPVRVVDMLTVLAKNLPHKINNLVENDSASL